MQDDSIDGQEAAGDNMGAAQAQGNEASPQNEMVKFDKI